MKNILREALRSSLTLGGVALLWSLSYWIFISACTISIVPSDPGSLATALFGSSSVSLFFLSFLVALMAAFGWQSYKDFRENISKDVKDMHEKIESARNELRGRVETVIG